MDTHPKSEAWLLVKLLICGLAIGASAAVRCGGCPYNCDTPTL